MMLLLDTYWHNCTINFLTLPTPTPVMSTQQALTYSKSV